MNTPVTVKSEPCQCAALSVLRLVLQLRQRPAGQWQLALDQALKEICTILDCDRAVFIGWRCEANTTQRKSCPPLDSCGGWKPCLLMDALGNEVRQDRLVREWTEFVAAHGPDVVTRDVLNDAGLPQEYVVDRLDGPLPDCDWFHCGEQCVPAVDRISVTQELDPLSRGAICVERFKGSTFETQQHETLALLMDATADWQRRAMNAHGLCCEQKALSPRERDILAALLTTAPEKHIAAQLGLTVRTTHNYVTIVYRKMKVRSRAELMARFFNT